MNLNHYFQTACACVECPWKVANFQILLPSKHEETFLSQQWDCPEAFGVLSGFKWSIPRFSCTLIGRAMYCPSWVCCLQNHVLHVRCQIKQDAVKILLNCANWRREQNYQSSSHLLTFMQHAQIASSFSLIPLKVTRVVRVLYRTIECFVKIKPSLQVLKGERDFVYLVVHLQAKCESDLDYKCNITNLDLQTHNRNKDDKEATQVHAHQDLSTSSRCQWLCKY